MTGESCCVARTVPIMAMCPARQAETRVDSIWVAIAHYSPSSPARRMVGPSRKGLPHGLKVRGDAARLLVTLVPAGAAYFFVPRDESDGDPAKFGLEIQGDAPRG
jgi:hypothetical protein